MPHKIKNLGTIGMILGLLAMAACSPPAGTSTPTVDLNPFRTEVAATVLAEVAQAQALTPSATPIPSLTPTLPPTATPTPTQKITATTPVTATLSAGTPITGTNRAQWVFQSVADDTIFLPGEAFTMIWRLKNAGTTTWTVNYLLRFFSGNAFGAPQEIPLSKDVLPGETIDITLNMKAPANPGDYRTDWVLSDAARGNFNEPVYLKIKVAAPPTRTPTPTRTPSPTP